MLNVKGFLAFYKSKKVADSKNDQRLFYFFEIYKIKVIFL